LLLLLAAAVFSHSFAAAAAAANPIFQNDIEPFICCFIAFRPPQTHAFHFSLSLSKFRHDDPDNNNPDNNNESVQ